MKYTLKIILILLLIGCLFKMPYGYYQFFRIGGTVMFVWLASIASKNKQAGLMLFFGLIAALLQPAIKIHFTRQVWNIIDVAIAVVLFGILIFEIVERYQLSRNLKPNKLPDDFS